MGGGWAGPPERNKATLAVWAAQQHTHDFCLEAACLVRARFLVYRRVSSHCVLIGWGGSRELASSLGSLS